MQRHAGAEKKLQQQGGTMKAAKFSGLQLTDLRKSHACQQYIKEGRRDCVMMTPVQREGVMSENAKM